MRGLVYLKLLKSETDAFVHNPKILAGQDDGGASFERNNSRRNCRCSEKSYDASQDRSRHQINSCFGVINRNEAVSFSARRSVLEQRKLSGVIFSRGSNFFRYELRIVSDANIFYIETILKHLGIRECFFEINTNPSFVDEGGRLRILPFHDFRSSSHGCGLCPPNMCKVMKDVCLVFFSFSNLDCCLLLKERSFLKFQCMLMKIHTGFQKLIFLFFLLPLRWSMARVG